MNRIIAITLMFLACGCKSNKVKLTGDYIIYRVLDRHPNGELTSGRNVLTCKLGNENDPLIEDLVSAQWNNKFMIISKANSSYIIEANEYGLGCGFDNRISGPLTPSQLDSFIISKSFVPNEIVNLN